MGYTLEDQKRAKRVKKVAGVKREKRAEKVAGAKRVEEVQRVEEATISVLVTEFIKDPLQLGQVSL